MTEGRVASDRQDYRHRRLSPSHVSLRAQVRPSHSSLQAQLREIFSRWESYKSTRSKFPRTATLASQMLTEAQLTRDMRCRHAVAFPRLVRMPIAIVTSVLAAVTTTKRPFGNTSADKATVERAEVRSSRERHRSARHASWRIHFRSLLGPLAVRQNSPRGRTPEYSKLLFWERKLLFWERIPLG